MPVSSAQVCEIQRCERPQYGKGMCQRHYNKAYYAANRERLRARKRPNEEALRARARELRLLRSYGISQRDYEGFRDAQDGRCAICDAEARLVVDHCHTTGRVRGLLCDACNKGIGLLGDDPTRTKRAAEYLLAASDRLVACA